MDKIQFDVLCGTLFTLGSIRHNGDRSVAISLRLAEHILFNTLDDILCTVEPEERKEWYEAAINSCTYGVMMNEDKDTLSEWIESLKDLGA